jgi:hypothetical protein
MASTVAFLIRCSGTFAVGDIDNAVWHGDESEAVGVRLYDIFGTLIDDVLEPLFSQLLSLIEISLEYGDGMICRNDENSIRRKRLADGDGDVE